MNKALKYKAIYGVLSLIEAQLFLKNGWLPPLFFWDTESTYEDLLYLHSFNPRKNILALVSIGNRKSEYLEMCRMYAQ